MMNATTQSAADRIFPRREDAAFFAAVRLRNGTFKTTAEHRLDDLNAFVMDCWEGLKLRPRQVLDVGVSSAVSSVEWYDALAAAGMDVSMVATDLCLKANVVRVLPGYRVMVDGTGHVLQHIVLGVPIRPWRRRLDYVTGFWLVNGVLNRLARWGLARSRAKASEEVFLLSRRALDHQGITVMEDDLLAANPPSLLRRFDAVRAANVLNQAYFSAGDLRKAVANLKDRLVGPNSFLIVNRTLTDGTNHGTLFRLNQGARFEALAKLRDGSEIEDIVLTT